MQLHSGLQSFNFFRVLLLFLMATSQSSKTAILFGTRFKSRLGHLCNSSGYSLNKKGMRQIGVIVQKLYCVYA